jgi:hypothetical protein
MWFLEEGVDERAPVEEGFFHLDQSEEEALLGIESAGC